MCQVLSQTQRFALIPGVLIRGRETDPWAGTIPAGCPSDAGTENKGELGLVSRGACEGREGGQGQVSSKRAGQARAWGCRGVVLPMPAEVARGQLADLFVWPVLLQFFLS